MLPLSPMMGGLLSEPYKRFPRIFGRSEFWKRYPYFLPCAFSATFAAFALLVVFVFLQEVSIWLFYTKGAGD